MVTLKPGTQNSLNATVEAYRVTEWWEMPMTLENLVPSKQRPLGTDHKRKLWNTLNRARAGVATTGDKYDQVEDKE